MQGQQQETAAQSAAVSPATSPKLGLLLWPPPRTVEASGSTASNVCCFSRNDGDRTICLVIITFSSLPPDFLKQTANFESLQFHGSRRNEYDDVSPSSLRRGGGFHGNPF
ncbi:unnamed protein product [Cuscuta epithymum]|uniref:Uncharacterized protein n=1 Tax=Cuscuta epithymum TaxID=186058 RepID=A0AAV0DHA0_9ASTE|nr:unnamed protein product [Cuscuta epithymum]